METLEDQGTVMTRFWPLTGYTPFAGGIRYGDEDIGATPIDREDAIRLIDELLGEVLRQFPEDEVQ